MALLIKATIPEPALFVVFGDDPMPEPAPIGEDVKPANGKSFTLEELQGYVGGLIEMSFFHDGRVMISNEEGKLVGLLVNVEATLLYRAAWTGVSDWAARDTIVGDVLICSPAEVGD
jgi:hypothetical protein